MTPGLVRFAALCCSLVFLAGAASALCAAAPRRWRIARAVIVVGWFVLATNCTTKMIATYHKRGYTISYADLRDSVRRSSFGRPVAALTRDPQPFEVLNLISGDTGVSIAAVLPEQLEYIS